MSHSELFSARGQASRIACNGMFLIIFKLTHYRIADIWNNPQPCWLTFQTEYGLLVNAGHLIVAKRKAKGG
jgi:hypothetical protein